MMNELPPNLSPIPRSPQGSRLLQDSTVNGSSHWVLSGQIDKTQPITTYPIYTTPFTIGRQHDSCLSIPIGCISKNHAEIVRGRKGELILRDLGSTNGTYVNGLPLSAEVELTDGDLIQFATIIFRVGKNNAETQCNTVEESAGDQALAMVQFDRLINDGGLLPHFQPIVKLSDQTRVGYEILGRSRLFGLQNPMDMFFAASRLDLEAQLSEAFRMAGVEIGSRFGKETNLFLNTHPKELDREEFYGSLRELRNMFPEQTMTLEIHEAAVTNLTMMRHLCSILRDLDIKLAFDDFGVGQARLVELGEVRPDYLKFDMKLTKNIHRATPQRQEVVALFASLVNNLGIQTLAEGIETIECHETLVQMGFELGQGYYYGRPGAVQQYLPKNDADEDPSATI